MDTSKNNDINIIKYTPSMILSMKVGGKPKMKVMNMRKH